MTLTKINCINPDCYDNWGGKRKMTVNRLLARPFVSNAQPEKISFSQALKIGSATAPVPYVTDRLSEAINKISDPEHLQNQ